MLETVPVWIGEGETSRSRLAGPRGCEVCVIGAGIGGIATAWRLAAAGIAVIVIEERVVASGATGRNGGFFMAGAAPMYDRTRQLWGRERAARIYSATLAAQRQMLEVAEEINARHHFSITGLLRLAVSDEEAEAVRVHSQALLEDGFPHWLVSESSLPAAVRREGRIGLLTPNDGTVHPVQWVRALAGDAEARGAAIFEGTRVTAAPFVQDGVVVTPTNRGAVYSDRAVVAVDAALASLLTCGSPVRSRRLNMLATSPIPPGHLELPIYARFGHEWAQQLPDGRVAIGGFSDLDGNESWTERELLSEKVQMQLDRYLRDELGVQSAVTHRWVGLVGYAPDALPTCGLVPGSEGRIFAIGGYNGTGHVQAWIASRVVSDLIIAGESADSDLYAPVVRKDHPGSGPP